MRSRFLGWDRHEKRKADTIMAKTKTFERIASMLSYAVYSMRKMTTVKRRIIRAGGWGIAKRLIKPIPIVGSILAFGLAGYEIKKKGLIPGAVHVGLDVTPVVGTAKNVIEIFTGDLIPDKTKPRITRIDTDLIRKESV